MATKRLKPLQNQHAFGKSNENYPQDSDRSEEQPHVVRMKNGQGLKKLINFEELSQRVTNRQQIPAVMKKPPIRQQLSLKRNNALSEIARHLKTTKHQRKFQSNRQGRGQRSRSAFHQQSSWRQQDHLGCCSRKMIGSEMIWSKIIRSGSRASCYRKTR